MMLFEITDEKGSLIFDILCDLLDAGTKVYAEISVFMGRGKKDKKHILELVGYSKTPYHQMKFVNPITGKNSDFEIVDSDDGDLELVKYKDGQLLRYSDRKRMITS